MCIELFKWKAHRDEVAQIRHVSKRNVFVTAARENSLQVISASSSTSMKDFFSGHMMSPTL